MTRKQGQGVTVMVGDPSLDLDVDDDVLLEDLAHLAHEQAALEYGIAKRCSWEGFAGAGARPAFEKLLAEVGTAPAVAARHLQFFDACTRPYAVVHLLPTEVH